MDNLLVLLVLASSALTLFNVFMLLQLKTKTLELAAFLESFNQMLVRARARRK